MRSKRRILLAATVVIALIVLTWAIFRSPEPAYEGVPLSVWLQRYEDLNYFTVSEQSWHREADEAVRNIGTNALPILLELIDAKDSRFKLKMMDLAGKQSVIKTHFTTAKTRQQIALTAFRVLGPAAKPAIPKLGEILASGQWMAAPALSAIGPDSIGTLVNGLTNTNAMVRRAIIIVLGQYAHKAYSNQEGKLSYEDVVSFRAAAAQIIPALGRCTNDPDENARYLAGETLKYFNKASDTAAEAGAK
jgi:hypothetical protein